MRYILLFIVIFTLASCKKEVCYKCHTYRYNSISGEETSTSEMVCNMTDDEARQYERDHSSTSTGSGPTFRITTVCVK